MSIKFGDIFHKKYFGKPVTIKCIVSGKSISAPYSIPKRIKISCFKDRDKKCKGENCVINRSNIVELGIDDNLLRFIDITDAAIPSAIKSSLKISCKFSYKVLSVQNVERIFISAPTGKERNTNTSSYVGYYLGYGIDVNTVYELSGVVMTDPKDQLTTCLFTEAVRLKSDVETFAITKDIKHKLNKFNVHRNNVEDIFHYLDTLYTSYARNITKIHDRFHLHAAIDIAFHSPLSFYFDNEYVHKGWMDIVIIGDTRCGKGYVAERLCRFFNVGEVVSGDNASFAGLIVGLQKFGDHWTTSWGKIPMNDKGLVIIDEAGSISHDDWTKLSRVRSEGVAEVIKINKQITNARTRLISLMNPPLKTIASYSYGIQSLMDVIKAPEDIARFDYALVVSHDEVSVKDINRSRKEITPLYTSEEEELLIMWIWSRKPDQIKFTDDAVKHTYQCAVKLANEYSFSIPLIQGENVRIKLAKVAVCLAGRLYSHDGPILVVEKLHVECAHVFFNLMYKQDASGYKDMSMMQKSVDIETNSEDLKSMVKYFSTFKDGGKLLKTLLNNNRFSVNDLVESLNLPKEFIHELISKMLDHNLIIRRGYGAYDRTPAFTSWLKKKVLNKGERE